jgi:hypothetical protein
MSYVNVISFLVKFDYWLVDVFFALIFLLFSHVCSLFGLIIRANPYRKILIIILRNNTTDGLHLNMCFNQYPIYYENFIHVTFYGLVHSYILYWK